MNLKDLSKALQFEGELNRLRTMYRALESGAACRLSIRTIRPIRSLADIGTVESPPIGSVDIPADTAMGLLETFILRAEKALENLGVSVE